MVMTKAVSPRLFLISLLILVTILHDVSSIRRKILREKSMRKAGRKTQRQNKKSDGLTNDIFRDQRRYVKQDAEIVLQKLKASCKAECYTLFDENKIEERIGSLKGKEKKQAKDADCPYLIPTDDMLDKLNKIRPQLEKEYGTFNDFSVLVARVHHDKAARINEYFYKVKTSKGRSGFVHINVVIATGKNDGEMDFLMEKKKDKDDCLTVIKNPFVKETSE
ncbi:unnamed protein product [Owenia fusiformis]|uniref:Uncharacterized protein n=1 Tax=Owenia fusiformis TaxID=6347 RepID=A0A8S4Q632_OWEFU|nr:unnamed protein product [Owenia fusiformis]